MIAAPVEVLPPALPALRTARLLLRPLMAGDRAAFLHAAAATREELDRLLPLHMEGESDSAMFERQLALAQAGPGRDWLRLVAVLEGVDGECGGDGGVIAGGVNLNAISRGLSWRADINWWIARPLAGRGLATEAIGAVVEHALADLPGGMGLSEIHAWITRDNLASVRIAEKLGFRRAGRGAGGHERTYLLTDSGSWVLHDLWVKSV